MLPLFFRNIEGYENYKLENIISNIPDSETKVLVQDTYPPIGKNKISNDTASSIWWHYPVFTLGSYKQITNNIRYPNNPDEGTCMPASMCGSLYKEKHLASNYVTPLPPVIGDKTRIGYFTTDKQLIDSLPFRSDGPNILY
jgi:hypothetical protein